MVMTQDTLENIRQLPEFSGMNTPEICQVFRNNGTLSATALTEAGETILYVEHDSAATPDNLTFLLLKISIINPTVVIWKTSQMAQELLETSELLSKGNSGIKFHIIGDTIPPQLSSPNVESVSQAPLTQSEYNEVLESLVEYAKTQGREGYKINKKLTNTCEVPIPRTDTKIRLMFLSQYNKMKCLLHWNMIMGYLRICKPENSSLTQS